MGRKQREKHLIDLPAKTDPAEFGGGRVKGVYQQWEIERLLCCVAGCARRAFATWGGCADGNIKRPFCAEHDIDLNWQVLLWAGDPERDEKITRYANDVDRRLRELTGRGVDDTALPFLERAS